MVKGPMSLAVSRRGHAVGDAAPTKLSHTCAQALSQLSPLICSVCLPVQHSSSPRAHSLPEPQCMRTSRIWPLRLIWGRLSQALTAWSPSNRSLGSWRRQASVRTQGPSSPLLSSSQADLDLHKTPNPPTYSMGKNTNSSVSENKITYS